MSGDGDVFFCNIHGEEFTISEDGGICPSCQDEWSPVEQDEDE